MGRQGGVWGWVGGVVATPRREEVTEEDGVKDADKYGLADVDQLALA